MVICNAMWILVPCYCAQFLFLSFCLFSSPKKCPHSVNMDCMTHQSQSSLQCNIYCIRVLYPPSPPTTSSDSVIQYWSTQWNTDTVAENIEIFPKILTFPTDIPSIPKYIYCKKDENVSYLKTYNYQNVLTFRFTGSSFYANLWAISIVTSVIIS